MPNWAIVGIVGLSLFGIALLGLGGAAAITALQNFHKTFE